MVIFVTITQTIRQNSAAPFFDSPKKKKSYLTAVWDIEHIYEMVIMLIVSKWDCCVSRAGQESRILFPAHVCRLFLVFWLLHCARRHKVGDSDYLCQVLWNSLLRSGVSGWQYFCFPHCFCVFALLNVLGVKQEKDKLQACEADALKMKIFWEKT